MIAIITSLFVCGIVEMYYGAVQLGMLNSPVAGTTAYAVLIGCFVVIAFIFAIFVGDYMVPKCTGYHRSYGYGRWDMHTGGGGDGFESAPGRWIYVFIVFVFQTPTIYFTLLFVRS